MIGVFSYLITMIAGLFWIFRIVVAVTCSLGVKFLIVPFNLNIEIGLLFLSLICFVFIVKRNIIGALVYFVGYGLYFGNDLYDKIPQLIQGKLGVSSYFPLFISFLGVLIPFLIVLDIFFNRDRTGEIKDRKTDWYYKNKQYDRDLDDRADKNEYKF